MYTYTSVLLCSPMRIVLRKHHIHVLLYTDAATDETKTKENKTLYLSLGLGLGAGLLLVLAFAALMVFVTWRYHRSVL